ncbi:MAG: 3-keto-5-aminohexanoate cleavage protein [Clostridia bacterium]|nr:3-keto-5-aminohexanoate cleavage protein [Clostridia bacterium]
MSKVIITAAITGSIHTPTMSEYLPITPKQIADEIVRAYEAGAAVAHVHVRDPENGRPTQDLNLFREVIADVYSRCNIVLCLTTGAGLGMTIEQRVAAVPEFEPELASFNAGSLNFALFPMAERIKEFKFSWEKEYLEMTEDFIFPNTFKTLRRLCEIFARYGTKPELEVYDAGMINNVAFLIERGYLKKPVYIQFVMGILGGIPASVENLVFLKGMADRMIGDFQWSVATAGRNQLPIGAAALAMGGNVRVGLEDALYAGKGLLAKSNADQVERIVSIAHALSLDVATPDDAREILGLKGRDKMKIPTTARFVPQAEP